VNEPEWASTPRGRKELLAVGLFCLAFTVVPLVTTELYPFSRAPMFADAPREYCDYAIVTPDGRRLTEDNDAKDLISFGVQRNYWGNPLGVGVGFAPPASVDDFGTVAAKETVVAEVAQRLQRFPELKYVDVEQSVWGPTDAQHVGVTRTERWRVDNPYYQPGAGP
jgi:hypothetical protein